MLRSVEAQQTAQTQSSTTFGGNLYWALQSSINDLGFVQISYKAQNEGLGRRQSVRVQDRAAARAEKSLNAATVSASTRPALVSRASPGLYQRTSPPLRRQWCLHTSPQPSANLAPVHKIENTCLTRSCNNSDYPTNRAAGVQYGRKSRRRL